MAQHAFTLLGSHVKNPLYHNSRWELRRDVRHALATAVLLGCHQGMIVASLQAAVLHVPVVLHVCRRGTWNTIMLITSASVSYSGYSHDCTLRRVPI